MNNYSEDSRTVQELIRIVFEKFNRRQRRNLSKKQILKILYKVKINLPEHNPIKNDLAYYWYIYGPTSDVIYKNFEQMINNNMIHRKNHQLEIYYFSPDMLSKRMIPHDENISQASSEIIKHVNDFRNMPSLINEIYEKSPSNLYKYYNIIFKNRFDNFCDYILNPKKINSESRYKNKEILESFQDTIIRLPGEKVFFDFRKIYLDYAKCITVLLSVKKSCDQNHKEYFKTANDLCGKVWTAFAYNIRLKEHDSYYEEFINRWQQDCTVIMDKLRTDVKEFSSSVLKLPVSDEKFTDEIETKIELARQDKISADNVYTPEKYLEKINNLCK